MLTFKQALPGILAGESGGDYNALFGFSNRPGGAFSNVRVTDMTVDEALAFSDPSGPYAQWVKNKIGRVATPMGGIQVVGSTLRDAKKGLGLTGSEKMDEATQNRIGEWIFQNQGVGAWEGYRPTGGGGSATMTGSAGNDTLGVPMQDEQQPQNFWQRIRERPEMMMAIGGALQNLGWRGSGDDTMRAANAMLLGRSAEAKAQKQQTRTAQWLAQMGRADLAEAVASGALDGRSAVALAYQKPENDQTSAMQNYQFLLAQGVDPETAMGRAFSGGTTVNVGGDSSAPDSVLRETMQKKEGESLNKLSDAGNKAAGVMRDLQLLRELSAQAPEGPIQGQLAEMFPQYNDVAALRQAIVKRVAPTLRVEGSGSTSDIEYSGMIEGLGRLPNSREVNVAIADAMIQKAELDIRRSEIIGQYQRGEIEYNQMQSAIEQLNRQFKVPDGIAQILSSNQPSAAGGDYQVIDGVQIRRRN